MTPARTSIKKSGAVQIFFSCAPSWNRTNDPLLKRQVLYRLSYGRNLSPDAMLKIYTTE